MRFEDIVAPLGAEKFKRDYLGQKPLHLQGSAEKFHSVMNWDVLNRLLEATPLWTSQTMLLILDRETIPAPSYCVSTPGREGIGVMRPDPEKVQQFLARGATMVLNFIDQFTPELRAFSRALGRELGGTVQANLYLSSKRKQGFNAHFDFHDVFAMHVMGEKTWSVFQGRCEWPIKHPMFEGWSREQHDQIKGELWRDVTLRPGDLLYLPRGQYHYALADDGPCVHLAWGVTYPIGMDVVSYAFERTAAETLGRQNLPHDRDALRARLRELGQLISGILADPKALDDMQGFVSRFSSVPGDYDLPAIIEQAEMTYRVKRAGLRLVSQGGRHGLVREGARQAVEIPATMQPQVAWVLDRDRFAKSELVSAFPAEGADKLDRLIGDLSRMALLEPA
ncbi:MAG: cupin domain-containing protein [Geminicoccaceae bacterium]